MGFEYPECVGFQCTRCTICCGNTKNRTRRIVLLKEEAFKIYEAVLRSVEAFATPIADRGQYVYEMRKTREDGKCIFLKDVDCGIYAVRPLVCRFYPFELTTLRSGKKRFLSTGECPGIGKGETMGKEYFENLFRLACQRLGR